MIYQRMPSKAEFMKDTDAGVFAKRHRFIQAIDKLLDEYQRASDVKKTVVAYAIIENCNAYEQVLISENRLSSNKRLDAVNALREIARSEIKRLALLLKALEARENFQESQRVGLLNNALAAREKHQRMLAVKAKFANAIKNPKFKALAKVHNYGEKPGIKALHEIEILEVLDEMHRAGHELHKVRQAWLEKPDAPANFWDYLDQYVKDNPDNKLYQVKYLSENERRAYRIRFQGNMLMQGELGKTQRFDTSRSAVNSNIAQNIWGRQVFVMSVENRIYSGGSFSNPKKLPDGTVDRRNPGDIIHHSSFLMGCPVRCAGEWIVRNGRIIMISPQSGHYRPPAHIFQAFLKMLESHRIPLDQLTVSLYFGGNHFYNAKEYAYASHPEIAGHPSHNGNFLREVVAMDKPKIYKQFRPAPISIRPTMSQRAQQPPPVPARRQAPPVPPRIKYN